MPKMDVVMDEEIVGMGRRSTVNMGNWIPCLDEDFPHGRSARMRDLAEDYVREVYDRTWGHRRPGAE